MTWRTNRNVGLIVAVAFLGLGCGAAPGDKLGSQKQQAVVTWGSAVNVDVVGSNLTKNGTTGWNAGAVSNETLAADGYVQWTTAENTTFKMAGLSNGNTDESYGDIDFAINMAGNGQIYIYEGGVYRGNFGAYAANDVFRIQVTSGAVSYYRNSVLIYESAGVAASPLLLDTSLYTNGATIQNAEITATTSATWQNEVNVTTTATSITKTSGAIGWNAGASSVATLTGDGYIEFQAGQTNTYKMMGLSNGDTDQNYAEIDYAINLAGDGVAYIYENGVYRGGFGAYLTTDIFRIQVASNIVSYYRNGALLRTSTVTPPTFPLRIDSSLYNTNASFTGVTVSGPVAFWQNAVYVAASTNNLTKTGAAGWNAGASTVGTIAGDGYAEFTTNETNTTKMAGLSNGDTDRNYTDIDYAINMSANGNVYIYEGGTYRGSFGAYAAGGVFRVQLAAGVVSYYYNSTLLYTSTVAATSPLRVDTSLYTTGATINTVSLTDATPSATWQNQAGVSENGASLTKSGVNGWNAGASTVAALAANGYVEFTTAENTTTKMAGLSNGDTNVNYTDIDYAINMSANGNVYIYEGGTLRGAFGTYAATDVFRVSVTGGVVTYYQNSNLLYTSTVAATSPLLVDTALYTNGATINTVTLTNVP